MTTTIERSVPQRTGGSGMAPGTSIVEQAVSAYRAKKAAEAEAAIAEEVTRHRTAYNDAVIESDRLRDEVCTALGIELEPSKYYTQTVHGITRHFPVRYVEIDGYVFVRRNFELVAFKPEAIETDPNNEAVLVSINSLEDFGQMIEGESTKQDALCTMSRNDLLTDYDYGLLEIHQAADEAAKAWEACESK